MHKEQMDFGATWVLQHGWRCSGVVESCWRCVRFLPASGGGSRWRPVNLSPAHRAQIAPTPNAHPYFRRKSCLACRRTGQISTTNNVHHAFDLKFWKKKQNCSLCVGDTNRLENSKAPTRHSYPYRYRRQMAAVSWKNGAKNFHESEHGKAKTLSRKWKLTETLQSEMYRTRFCGTIAISKDPWFWSTRPNFGFAHPPPQHLSATEQPCADERVNESVAEDLREEFSVYQKDHTIIHPH